MELLLPFIVAVSIVLAFCVYRERKARTALDSAIRSRDEEIRKLRSQKGAFERDDLERKALLSAISVVAFDVVLLLDEELTVLMYSQSAEGLLGNRNPTGERLTDVIDSGDLLNLVQLAMQENESLEDQFVIDKFNYRARAYVINCANGSRYIGVALQDITDLVNLNRARRDLVANISHELRTPITRIRLIIEGLFLDVDKPKRKASIQSLKEIAMETDGLLWLAQELLDLSMIESGEAILRLVNTPLKQVVDDAIEQLEAHAEMKDLKIESQVPKTFDVLCDADQLKRVIGNLLHNAIKWSPRGQAITITASEQVDEVTVSVLDNGPGVPDDLCERVFERFYQADVSHSGDEGTGLGLAICKHIVEAHGGKVRAEGNSQGRGGHFSFTVLKADADFPQDSVQDERDEAQTPISESVSLP